MSGRLQHYIPQMLLRRFSKSQDRVKISHKDGRSFSAHVKKTAVRRDYFGPPGPGTADEALTVEENRIGAILSEVAGRSEGPVSRIYGAYLFAHFTMRVQSLRRFMHDAGAAFVEDFDRLYLGSSDYSELKKFAGINEEFYRTEIDKLLLQALGPQRLEQFKGTPQYESALKTAKEQAEAAIDAAMESDFRPFWSQMRSDMQTFVEKAHIKATMQGPTPQGRREAFEAFEFEVRQAERDLVLGDSIAWGARGDGGILPLHEVSENIKFIAMPLSLRTYLIGAPSLAEVQRPSVEFLRDAAARCSESFIVSALDDGGVESLRALIGEAYSRALALARLKQ